MLLSTILALSLGTEALTVGVTVAPYGAWTRAVSAGLPVNIQVVAPAGAVEPGALAGLDALVVSGLGADGAVLEALAASGNRRCRVIRLNEDTLVLPGAGGGKNPYSFLSFTNAMQQTTLIARELGELRPGWKPQLERGARVYSEELRALRVEAVRRFAPFRGVEVVTLDEAFTYLARELGLTRLVQGTEHTREPASAAALARALGRMGASAPGRVLVVAPAQAEVARAAAAREEMVVAVVERSVMTALTPEAFREAMLATVDTLLRAVQATDARPR